MLLIPRTFHKSDAKQFSKSPVLVDPRNQTNLTNATQTDSQCNVWQCLAESLLTLRIVRIVHRQFANEAMMIPRLVHPLQDQIQHHLDWKMVAKYEIS